MLIAGASGHAKEILDIVEKNNKALVFFDNISISGTKQFFGKYGIIGTKVDVINYFKSDNRFAIGVGSPKSRYELALLLKEWGGELTSIISPTSLIGSHSVNLGKGLNIMHQTMISNDVSIGEGSLINTASTIHHDVSIGSYCEISPGVRILGGAKIGDFCSIGCGAIILPNIKIGNNVVIGAGAVVNKDLPDNSTGIGIPVKIIKNNE